MEMKKSVTSGKLQTGERGLPIIGGVFLLGAVAGSLCCMKMTGLQNLMFTEQPAQPAFWQAFLPEAGLFCLIFLAGFVRQGAFITWFTIAVKGFLLSAGSTAMVLQQGNMGYPHLLAQYLLPQLVAVAAMVLLGRQAVGWSVRRLHLPAGRGKRILPDGTYLTTAAVCALLLLLSALLRVRVSPALDAAVQLLLSSE